MRRGVRLFDLLKRLDEVDPDIGYYDVDSDRRDSLDHRSVHKDEMIEILGIIGEPTDWSDAKVPELRDEIRDIINYKTRKSGSSQFASRELYNINRAIDSAQRLEAENIDIRWLSLIGDTITVNGVNYTVDDAHVNQDAHPDALYESYDMIELSPDRWRIMVLYDLDTDECKYKSSVVLEKAHDYGPYKRWKKDSYVKSIET